MRIWITIAYEPLPFIDGRVRLLRYGTLSSMLAKVGHEVIWWTSSFDHVRKIQRCKETTSVELKPGWRVNMLAVPGYKTNISLARIRHNISLSRKFSKELDHCFEPPRF